MKATVCDACAADVGAAGIVVAITADHVSYAHRLGVFDFCGFGCLADWVSELEPLTEAPLPRRLPAPKGCG